jgi:hypothetical protein
MPDEIRRIGWDYGYRSRCCYAPIRLGRKKIKKTNQLIPVWVCTKCRSRNVDIVEYTKEGTSKSSQKLSNRSSFIPDEE